MTISGFETPQRGLDSMLVVYAAVRGHPAEGACQRFLRDREGWLALPTTLLEAYHVLVRAYNVDPGEALDSIAAFADGPVHLLPVDGDDALEGIRLASALGVDVSDALLLRACENLDVQVLATDDAHLARAAAARGLLIENPIDPALRQEIAEWEDAHLPPKGLSRVLHAVSQWLEGQSREIAESFTNATGNRAHLP